ncbi:MAG: hypothetical protein K8S98_13715 [Planctomycetes bacterium]|nr:hypothetical protein [Planctomycetota bacterium]
MSTCENCGTEFEPSNEPKEVTSLRVLCRKCEAERQARKKQQQAAAKPAPVPAAAPIARKATPAAAPAAKPAASARPAAPAPKPAVRAETKPAAKPAPVASKAAAKPAPRDAADQGDGKTTRSRDVMREKELLKQKQQKVIMYAWMVAGGAAVIALGFFLFAKHKNDVRTQAAAKVVAEQQQVLTDAQAIDISTEQGCQKLIEFLQDGERRKIWATSPQAGDVQTLLSRAKIDLQAKQERGAVKLAFEEMRTKLANPASMTADEINNARRRLVNEIDPKVSLMDQQFGSDVAQLKQNTDRAFAAKLHDEARTTGNQATDVDGRLAALKKYTLAEDELVKLFEAALKNHQTDLETFFGTHFREVIDESDLLAVAVFTPEYIEKQPWKDLLGTDQLPNWNAAVFEGFTHKFDRGSLALRGPNEAAKQEGVISVGDREQFRDFVLEFEFTIAKGEFDLYARVGKRFDDTVEWLRFSSLEESPKASFLLSAGESYSGTLTYIGSQWVCELSAGDPQKNEKVSWTRSRRGGIGLRIPPEADVKITRMRIKSLRQSGTN